MTIREQRLIALTLAGALCVAAVIFISVKSWEKDWLNATSEEVQKGLSKYSDADLITFRDSLSNDAHAVIQINAAIAKKHKEDTAKPTSPNP